MTDKLKAALARWSMLEQNDRVAVALSGGCDSVALLYALYELKDELGITLAAAHVNHHIRGDEADRDAQFVGGLCEKLGVKLYRFDVDVPTESAKTGESEELCARRLRYEALDSLVSDGFKVATAHTMSDNAETVLFNLSRGSSIKGLCGIPNVRGGYIRPLLLCTRTDTENYCAEHSLQFVHDSTNDCDDYTRNFLRHKVIPPLKEVLPSCEEAISRMSAQLSEIDEMLDRMACELIASSSTDGGWRRDILLKSERPVLSRALHRLTKEQTGHAPDSFHTDSLCRLVEDGGKLQLSGGCFAVCDDTLRFISGEKSGEAYRFALSEGEINTPWVSLEVSSFAEEKKQIVHNSVMLYEIDCDKIVGEAVIRCRKEGDSFRPDKRHTKPLRKWMNDCRIPAEQRDLWPVVADDEGVVCVVGIGVDSRVLPDENTKKCMIIKTRGK